MILSREARDADGFPVRPLDRPALIPGLHDSPHSAPRPVCYHCREPIDGIPCRAEGLVFHTACLLRVRTR